jgi:hypothetical protein
VNANILPEGHKQKSCLQLRSLSSCRWFISCQQVTLQNNIKMGKHKNAQKQKIEGPIVLISGTKAHEVRTEAHEGYIWWSCRIHLLEPWSLKIIILAILKKLKRGKHAHTIFSGSFSFLNTSKNWKRDWNLTEKWYLLPLKLIHWDNITWLVATATEHFSEMESALQANIKWNKPNTFHQNHFSEWDGISWLSRIPDALASTSLSNSS